MKSVTLYEAKIGFWLTTASFRENGDLIVRSGDEDNEWAKIIPVSAKPTLLNALLEDAAVGEVLGDEDDRLLLALSASFGDNENAFEDFKVFLERHSIPETDSNWLWAND